MWSTSASSAVRSAGLCGGLVVLFFPLFLLFLFAGPAAAQQAAGIIGQLKDESGGILPGVTVTASSPSLQAKEVVDVSNAAGEYRLTPLPIGAYTVVYSLPGFRTVRREQVRLDIGVTVRLDVVMTLGALEETVTVSGATPVVDITSTSAATQLTLETIELTPTSRNGLLSILAQAPGVRTPGLIDIAGGSVGDSPRIASFGQPDDNQVVMEGLWTTDPRMSSMGHNYFDYNALEEARVQTIGNGPEVQTRGPAIHMVLKSGGNEFHGSGEAAYTSHRFESNNLSDRLRAQGITSGNPLKSRGDVGGTVGGRIIRNKLWFFGAARYRPQRVAQLGFFDPDGNQGIFYRNETLLNQKLSYQMTQSNKFVFWHQWGLKQHGNDGANEFLAWESRPDRRPAVGTDIWKAEWQAVRGNSLVMSLLVGRTNWIAGSHASIVRQTDDLRDAGVPGGWEITHTAALNDPDFGGGRPSYRDQVTLYQWGSPAGGGSFGYNTHYNYKGTVSWYRPDLFAGNHEFKGGAEYFPASFQQGQGDRGGAGQYRLVLSRGAPTEIEMYNYPVVFELRTASITAYGGDKWTIGRRLTLDLGGRFERDAGWVPQQCRLAGEFPFAPAECVDKTSIQPLTSFAPRVYFSYDIGGNGRTALKGGWGRFYKWRYINEFQFLNPLAAVTSRYRWHDLNGNLDYDTGEVDLDQNGPDFISNNDPAGGINNPEERPTGTDQLALTFERELGFNFGVRASAVYIRSFDVQRLLNVQRPYDAYSIPVSNPDPGPDGAVGTGDDPGRMLTYFEYPATLAGRENELFMFINDPRSDDTHKAIELQLTKRIANRWQLLASYSITKNDVFVPLPASQASQQFNPNEEINASDRSTEHTARVSGLYRLPFDMTVSANFQSTSGAPQARQVLVTGGRQIPNLVINAEPLGSVMLPTLNVLDFRVEKSFSLAGGRRVSVRANLFNALNADTTLAWTLRSGPAFMRPTSIMRPRIVEFSLFTSF
jgi:hypothetical protein